MDREKVIADIEEQIAWIQDNDFHKFPGWGHAVLAMKDALALLKEQEGELYKLDRENQLMLERIAEQPQIVRCKDCNNGVIHCENGDIICDHVDSSGNDTHPADWFCADGERT